MDIAACDESLRHPMDFRSDEVGYEEEVHVHPFLVRSPVDQGCFAQQRDSREEASAIDFERARQMWSAGKTDEAKVHLNRASIAGHSVAKLVLPIIADLGSAPHDTAGVVLERARSRDQKTALAAFHFLGVSEFGSLAGKINAGLMIDDPFSLAVGAELLLGHSQDDRSAEYDAGLSLLQRCYALAPGLTMPTATRYCRQLLLNLVRNGRRTEPEHDDVAGVKAMAAAMITKRSPDELSYRADIFSGRLKLEKAGSE